MESLLYFVRSDLPRWLREPVWTRLTPRRISSKQPSVLQHFMSLAVYFQLLWFYERWQWLKLWVNCLKVVSGAILDNLHCPTCLQLQLQEDIGLHYVSCRLYSTTWSVVSQVTSHGAGHLVVGKWFKAWEEINLKRVKKSKSKCLHRYIQVQAPVAAGEDVFCYQLARTSQQLRS